MKIAVKFDHYFVADADKIPAILEALANGKLFKIESGWGFDKNTKLVAAEERPEIHFIDDTQFVDPPEPIARLRAQLKQSEDHWIGYYNKNTELEKKVKELEEKLQAIKDSTE